MNEKFILPLNFRIDLKFVPQVNKMGQAYQCLAQGIVPDTWYYSSNNNSYRDKLYNLGMKIKNIPKFNAEIASFAGNIFCFLLSGAHPTYYACQNLTEQNPEDSFVRICKGVAGFTEWKDCVKVSSQGIKVFDEFYSWENIENIPLNGLTSMLVVGLFLSESDWANINFGLVKGDKQVIRIDPGMSFDNGFLYNDSSDILKKLSHLLSNFIYKMRENYFSDFFTSPAFDTMDFSDLEEDIAPAALIHDHVNHLFQSKTELFETLYKIITLTEEDYFRELKKSSSGEFEEFWKNFHFYFKKRIKCFKKAAMELNGFEEYFNQKIHQLMISEVPKLVQKPDKLQQYLPYFEQGTTIPQSKKFQFPFFLGTQQRPLQHPLSFVAGPYVPGVWRYPHILNPETVHAQATQFNFFRLQAEESSEKLLERPYF